MCTHFDVMIFRSKRRRFQATQHVVVSQNRGRGPPYRPQNTILLLWDPQEGTSNFGKPPCRVLRLGSDCGCVCARMENTMEACWMILQ